jgi:hypothetical protein
MLYYYLTGENKEQGARSKELIYNTYKYIIANIGN